MNPEDLSGLLGPGIGDALHDLAAGVPSDEAVVEVGSFRGQSTAYLASGARDGNGARVFAVDAWDLPGNEYGKNGYNTPDVRESFESQLRACRLWSRVTPIQAFSTDAAAEWSGPPVGLLFIDADHRYEPVKGDFEAWAPHLAQRCVVAFDDYDTKPNPGVARFVAELRSDWGVDIVAGHLAVCRRR